jgi:hypothetical protein
MDMTLDVGTGMWWVRAQDRPWGPYRDSQIERFVAERRVTPSTLVAERAGGPWLKASSIEPFATFFKTSEEGAREGAVAEPVSGPIAKRPAVVPPRERPLDAPSAAAVANDHMTGDEANFVVICELYQTGALQFESALSALGVFAPVASGAWILRTSRQVGQVRNHLSQKLGTGDRLMVIDATRDRLAWFNLGIESDAIVRQVWRAPAKDASRA